jgi:hypothetical protein
MKKTIILLVLLLVAGCWRSNEEIQIITAKELNEIKCKWQGPKMSQWFYVGSEDGHHLFVHRDLPKDKYYNVKMTEYHINNPMVISGDESKWILMPWGPDSDECRK